MTAYETIANADTYFSNRLHVMSWTDANNTDKTKALAEATIRLDRLNFKGTKIVSTQELEWPRYLTEDDETVTETPDDVKKACCELAFTLLDEIDPEKEYNNLNVTSRVFSTVRTTYDHSEVPEHIAAGIPSKLAWSYVKSWIAKTGSIKLSRVS